jgi:predicted transcriptional regulator
MEMTNSPLSETVAATVRAEMARRMIRQATLAEHLGYSQPKVSRRLSGDVPFTLDELSAVAAALGITLGELIISSVAAHEGRIREVIAA